MSDISRNSLMFNYFLNFPLSLNLLKQAKTLQTMKKVKAGKTTVENNYGD